MFCVHIFLKISDHGGESSGIQLSTVTIMNMQAYYVWVIDLLYSAWSLWECIMDVVPGEMELKPQVKTGSWVSHTHTQ